MSKRVEGGKIYCTICNSELSTLSNVNHLNCVFYRCLSCNHQVLSLNTNHEKYDYFDNVQEIFYEKKYDWILSPFARWISSQDAKERVKHLKGLIRGGKVLEVGPGSGEVMFAAKKEGFDIEGVECSKKLCNYLRSTSICKIYDGMLEEVDFGDTKYDVVLSYHVIEHVPDPVTHLECVARRINPGGYLILATPNSLSWNHRIFKRRWTGYSVAHLNLFSKDSIELCLRNAGWKILDISTKEYTFDLLYSIKTAIKPKKRILGTKLRDSWLKSMPLQFGRIVFFCFSVVVLPFCYIQSRLGGGNELLIIAQK